MAGTRQFLEGTGGKIAAGVLLVIAAVAVVFAVRSVMGPSEAVAAANTRTFIDAETGKPFQHELTEGESLPVRAPSGKESGYPAELCYWTKDGQVRNDPYPVLLNEALGKPGPTFCPDCGRLVVGHNPRPHPGASRRRPKQSTKRVAATAAQRRRITTGGRCLAQAREFCKWPWRFNDSS